MIPRLCAIPAAVAPRIAILWLVALVLGYAAAGQAQETPTAMVTQESNFQAWNLTCVSGALGVSQEEAQTVSAREGCSISTRFDLLKSDAAGQENKDTLLVFSVTRAPDGQGLVAVFSLPLGVYLPSGMALVFDGEQSLRLAFETCNQTGCHAGLRLSAELEELLKITDRLEILFNNQEQKTLKLPLYLAGFEQASQALAAALGQSQAAS